MNRDSGTASRGMGVVLIVLLLVVGVGAASWWAGRATLPAEPAADGALGQADAAVWGEVTQGSVGRSLPLSVTLRQPAVPVAANGLSGVVTSISPGEVDSGDVVYVVGRTPVRVVESERPFWRNLEKDLEGDDVAVLQELLIAQGFLEGEADGDFGAGTERAVKAWQKAQGLPQTGTLMVGELVGVASLPTVVTLGETITVGSRVGGGEDAVLAPTGEREFVLVVTVEQARLIPAEASVEVTFDDQTWTGVIAGSRVDETGSTEFELTAPDGGPVCGQDCGVLPGDEQVTLRSEVVITPRVEGASVPAAAVRTRADGTAYLVTVSGEVAVDVLGSGQGVAIVEGNGIEPGVSVLVTGEPTDVPGEDAGTTEGD